MKVQLIATGAQWVGGGVRSFSAVFDKLLSEARRRICLTAYSLTDKKVMESLICVLERGLELEIFVTDPADRKKNPFSERLQMLEERYRGMIVHYLEDLTLHAKSWWLTIDWSY